MRICRKMLLKVKTENHLHAQNNPYTGHVRTALHSNLCYKNWFSDFDFSASESESGQSNTRPRVYARASHIIIYIPLKASFSHSSNRKYGWCSSMRLFHLPLSRFATRFTRYNLLLLCSFENVAFRCVPLRCFHRLGEAYANERKSADYLSWRNSSRLTRLRRWGNSSRYTRGSLSRQRNFVPPPRIAIVLFVF